MVRRLRQRFALINFLILTLVMCAVFGGVYLMMQRTEERESRQTVHQAVSASWTDGAPAAEQYQAHDLIYLTISGDQTEAQTAYSAAAQDNPAAVDAALGLIGQGERSGTVSVGADTYYYEFRRVEEGYRMVLGGTAAERDTMRRLLLNCLVIAGFALVGLLIVSIFLSRWEVKPIAAAWETQRNFVSDASHELKTPLTVIATNTDLILANPDSTIAQHRKWLDYMKNETARMSQLVANLLFIAKVDAHEIKAVRREIDFSAFLEELCMMSETDVFETGRMLEYTIEPGLMLEADAEKMRRVYEILLDNAVKYSNAESVIRVRLLCDKAGRVCMMMSNDTEPLTKENLARLFDRFYRVDHSRARDTGGYGLGLNIAKCIVSLHGGTISASGDDTGRLVISIVF